MKDIETRRGFLTTLSAVGLNLAIEAIPALAQPASERPKEGDVLARRLRQGEIGRAHV